MKHRRLGTRDLMGALYPLLNVSTLTTLSTGGVHHGQAPQGTALPYVVLQEPSAELGLPAMQAAGEEDEFEVLAVSNAKDYAPALAILDVAVQLIDGERPALPHHTVIRLWWERSIVYRDPELVNGVPVWNALATFRALLDQGTA